MTSAALAAGASRTFPSAEDAEIIAAVLSLDDPKQRRVLVAAMRRRAALHAHGIARGAREYIAERTMAPGELSDVVREVQIIIREPAPSRRSIVCSVEVVAAPDGAPTGVRWYTAINGRVVRGGMAPPPARVVEPIPPVCAESHRAPRRRVLRFVMRAPRHQRARRLAAAVSTGPPDPSDPDPEPPAPDLGRLTAGGRRRASGSAA